MGGRKAAHSSHTSNSRHYANPVCPHLRKPGRLVARQKQLLSTAETMTYSGTFGDASSVVT